MRHVRHLEGPPWVLRSSLTVLSHRLYLMRLRITAFLMVTSAQRQQETERTKSVLYITHMEHPAEGSARR